MLLDEGADIGFQLLGGGMDVASELFSGKLCKPAFDLIDPRRRCWREMHVVVGSPCQPFFDHGGFMGGVIVHDDVNVEALWNTSIDLLEKIEKLSGSMALVAFTDHESRRDIERRKERSCAVTNIRMGAAFRNARHHW